MLLPIRMWLMFLFFRKRVFTERDMTRRELERLRRYVLEYPEDAKHRDRGMYLAFGWVRYCHEPRIVADMYNFEPSAVGGMLGQLIRFSRLWHKTGYKGYPIFIQL